MPPTGFKALGLRPELQQGLDRLGFAAPTEIQAGAFAPLRAGRDALLRAPTGTGKTLAYGLPLLDAIAGTTVHPRVLVLAPTRELALQIRDDLRAAARKWRPPIHAVVGGEPLEDQVRAMRRGAAVVVATPGRLKDLMEREILIWKHCHAWVLDEVDELLVGGFAPDLDAIRGHLPQRLQTVVASATMGAAVLAFAKAHFPDPVQVGIVEAPSSPAVTLRHHLILAPRHGKPMILPHLLGLIAGPTLVFVHRKEETRRLAFRLREAGFAAGYLSGELPLANRRDTLDRFREGTYQVLVATDVASRGLDLPAVEAVINYSVPVHLDQYVHRVGRAGRAGREGRAYTLSYREEADALKRLRGSVTMELMDLPHGARPKPVPWRPPEGEGAAPRPSRAPRSRA